MNKKVAKISRGNIVFPKNVIQINGRLIYNPTYDDYLKCGYKDYIDECPCGDENSYYLRNGFIENDNCISVIYERHVIENNFISNDIES